jgi:hypothetical protein
MYPPTPPTRSSLGRLLVLTALLAASLLPGQPGHARDTTPSNQNAGKAIELFEVRLERRISVDALGNARVVQKWSMSLNYYRSLIARLSPRITEEKKDSQGTRKVARLVSGPSTANVLSYLGLTSLPLAIEGLSGQLDDRAGTITATFQVPGWAIARAPGKWRLDLFDNARWYEPLDLNLPPISGLFRHTLTSFESGKARLQFDKTSRLSANRRLILASRVEITLPRSARAVKFAKQPNGLFALTYRAARPAPAGAEGQPPEFEFQLRKEIVPALHKLYGDPTWGTFAVARCSFTNPSNEVVEDLRVRCYVAAENSRREYNEWETVAGLVYPGGRVGFALHPLLDASLRSNRSRMIGKVHIEYEYTRPTGRKVRRLAEAGRITILGLNDSVETSLDLGALADPTYYHHCLDSGMILASFVHPNDPVIKDLKGRVSKVVGGLPINSSDRNTRLFLQALFDVLRVNVSYTNPTTGALEGSRIWQHFYYGRDVLRTRAGTCIDLAILYASVAEAVGMEVHIALVPGHALPAIRLPESGQLLFVETTLCGSGTLQRSRPFDEAVQVGRKTYDEAVELGLYYLIDVKALRSFISPPELPALEGANPLDDWKIAMPPLRPTATVTRLVKTRQDVMRGDRLGVEIVVEVQVQNARGQEFFASAVLSDRQGQPLSAVKSAFSEPGDAPLEHKAWAASKRLVASTSDDASYDVTLFLPYEEIPTVKADGVEREFRFIVDVYHPLYKEWMASKTQAGKLVVKQASAALAQRPRIP